LGLVHGTECIQESVILLLDNGNVLGTFRVRLVPEQFAPPRHEDNQDVDASGAPITNVRRSFDFPPPS
jgi:hypothetical protein